MWELYNFFIKICNTFLCLCTHLRTMKIHSKYKIEQMKNLKRNIYSICTLVVGLSSGFSQNLVKNPNMDEKCVSIGYGEIIKTESWTNANGGSVDLFDKKVSKYCSNANGIPENYMGYQPAFSTGQNYAGIIAFYDDGSNNSTDSMIAAKFKLKDGYKKYSEYLQGELTEPLVAGKVYQISFKVSLADKSARAVSSLGALLTPEKICEKSNSFLTQKPQFISYRIISDSVNWVTISGAFIAAGGEKFITIGCFKNEYFQSKKVVAPLHNDSRKAYYYIEDVSVEPYVAKPDLDALINGVDYIEIMNMQFALESAVIDPQFYGELDEVSSWMIKHPELKFFVAGYTDKTGNNTINDPLSIRRATEVKKYLVQKGVNESSLFTEGFGSSNPIERKRESHENRRVEIYLYSEK